MSVGERLRHERLRLGLSQPAFAAIAGATKSGLVKWEKDEASPNANAIVAWTDAGADALYILTGRRTFEYHMDDRGSHVRDQLAIARRDILDPLSQRSAGETADQAERRLLEWHADKLSAILRDDGHLLLQELKEEVADLLKATTDPAALSLLRAGEYARLRSQRRRERQHMIRYLEMNDRHVSDEAMDAMVSLVVDHSAPIGPVLDLALELLTPADPD